MSTLLVWWAAQTLLDHLQIQECVVFASRNETQTGGQNIGQRSGVAIQAIQTYQDLGSREQERGRVAGDHTRGPLQISSVVTIARATKSSHPLMGVRLKDSRPGSYHFPPLAPEIPRSRDLIKTTTCHGQGLQLGECSLTGHLFGSIHIDNDPMLAQTIPQATWGGERLARHEICLRIASAVPPRSLDQGLQESARAPSERADDGDQTVP